MPVFMKTSGYLIKSLNKFVRACKIKHKFKLDLFIKIDRVRKLNFSTSLSTTINRLPVKLF